MTNQNHERLFLAALDLIAATVDVARDRGLNLPEAGKAALLRRTSDLGEQAERLGLDAAVYRALEVAYKIDPAGGDSAADSILASNASPEENRAAWTVIPGGKVRH